MENNKIKYINNLQPEEIVAFEVGERTMSAKVTKISKERVNLKTKNGTEFDVSKSAIIWVKTGRWPKGVLDAFKKAGE